MPAVSRAQQQAMAIAEHQPGKLYARNRGLLQMSQGQLHDFAATKRTGLPAYASSSQGSAPVSPVQRPVVARRPRLADQITTLRSRGAFRAPPKPQAPKPRPVKQTFTKPAFTPAFRSPFRPAFRTPFGGPK